MDSKALESLVRPNVRSLRAYAAKDIPCRIKLDANESPYGFPLLKGIKTNRYPDPEAKGLKKSLCRQLGVSASNILVGNGSDELIYYLITTFGGPVLYPTPTFSMYGIIARALGAKTIEIPLEKNNDSPFDLDTKKILHALKKQRPKLVFLSSPNNPTGNCFSAERILKIIEASRGIVVVDEAYQPFSSKRGGTAPSLKGTPPFLRGTAPFLRGMAPFLKDYDNLVIMRSLSKIGLAALRVGFLAGDEAVIGEVNKVRLPYNLNTVSQTLAEKALKDRKQMRSFISSIVRERERLGRELAKIKDVACYPSEANFILFRVKKPGRVYHGLLKKGVLVRDMKGVIDGCLRVTVGTERENSVFLKALKKTVQEAVK